MKALIVAIAGLVGAGSVPASAATLAILQINNDGHDIIVVMKDGSMNGTVLSFSCTPGKDTFGLSLKVPGHDSWPTDGEDVAIKAGGDTLATQRFWSDGHYLIWGGQTARTTFKTALANPTVTLSVAGPTSRSLWARSTRR